jgi:hypothetical protein
MKHSAIAGHRTKVLLIAFPAAPLAVLTVSEFLVKLNTMTPFLAVGNDLIAVSPASMIGPKL